MTTPVGHVSAGAIPPPLPDGDWTVDPRRGEIGFAVREMWGLRTVRGVFRAYEGGLSVGPAGVASELSIDAGTLDTGNRRRDRHLCSPAFFDAERHRWIVFTATAVRAHEGGLAIAGELAIGSARVPLEIPVTTGQTADGALRLKGTATVSRQATGLGWNILGMIRGPAVVQARLMLERATS